MVNISWMFEGGHGTPPEPEKKKEEKKPNKSAPSELVPLNPFELSGEEKRGSELAQELLRRPVKALARQAGTGAVEFAVDMVRGKGLRGRISGREVSIWREDLEKVRRHEELIDRLLAIDDDINEADAMLDHALFGEEFFSFLRDRSLEASDHLLPPKSPLTWKTDENYVEEQSETGEVIREKSTRARTRDEIRGMAHMAEKYEQAGVRKRDELAQSVRSGGHHLSLQDAQFERWYDRTLRIKTAKRALLECIGMPVILPVRAALTAWRKWELFQRKSERTQMLGEVRDFVRPADLDKASEIMDELQEILAIARTVQRVLAPDFHPVAEVEVAKKRVRATAPTENPHLPQEREWHGKEEVSKDQRERQRTLGAKCLQDLCAYAKNRDVSWLGNLRRNYFGSDGLKEAIETKQATDSERVRAAIDDFLRPYEDRVRLLREQIRGLMPIAEMSKNLGHKEKLEGLDANLDQIEAQFHYAVAPLLDLRKAMERAAAGEAMEEKTRAQIAALARLLKKGQSLSKLKAVDTVMLSNIFDSNDHSPYIDAMKNDVEALQYLLLGTYHG